MTAERLPEVSFRTFVASVVMTALAAFVVGAFVVDARYRWIAPLDDVKGIEECLVSYFQVPPDQRTPDVLPDAVVAKVCDLPVDEVRRIRSAFNPDLYTAAD